MLVTTVVSASVCIGTSNWRYYYERLTSRMESHMTVTFTMGDIASYIVPSMRVYSMLT